jgi:hypothetical protein
MIYFKRLVTTLLLILVLSLFHSIYLFSILPSPSPAPQAIPFLLGVIFFCIIGPLTFAWAWGPQPMGIFYLLLAFAVPLVSGVLFYFGMKKEKLFPLLPIVAIFWSSFGAFSAYLAIIGTI